MRNKFGIYIKHLEHSWHIKCSLNVIFIIVIVCSIYHEIASILFSFLIEQGTKDYSLWIRGPTQIKYIFSTCKK